MSREILLEALNGIRDTYIEEAAGKLGLLAVGVAAGTGAALDAMPGQEHLFSLSGTETAAKAGFGAWLAKGGWVALVAGAVAAAGIAAGVFFLGGGKDTPSAESHKPITETVIEHDTDETETEAVIEHDTDETETEAETDHETQSETTGESETDAEEPTFDVDASLAAIDQLAIGNVSVSMKYQTKTYDGLSHEFSGGFGQVNGKYWYRVDMNGTAVQEEESGYYHKYSFEYSKWRYYDTYEITSTEEFDRVFNGRYWWKNYLDELTFDAYDTLTYVGIGQVTEQDCHMFTFDGTVTDGSQAALTLYVRVTDRNVMKMEVEVKSSTHNHLSTDARQATIEISSIKTGEGAKGPTLPNPKWDGPIEEPDETRDPTQGGVVIPPPDTEQTPSIDVESGTLEQLPLTSSDDTTSYIVLPDPWASGSTAVEFYILPTDTTDPAYTCALKYEIPENSTVNIQIVSVEKSPDEYSILFMMEYISNTVVEGVDTYRAFMTCAEIQFFTDASLSETQDYYYTLQGGKIADITYTNETMQDVIDAHRAESQAALEQAEALLANYTEDAGYTYTILYCRTKDNDIFNTPSYWIQPFFFELFKEWGLME